MSIVEKVTKKMNEYGIAIYKDYDIEKDEHVFYVENMMIFTSVKSDTIGISFQATTKPHTVSTLTLIINEIKCKEIYVMESFIFNNKNECVSGDAAYNLIKQSDHLKAVNEVQKEMFYTRILEMENGFEC
jgi:hypothetical protein